MADSSTTSFDALTELVTANPPRNVHELRALLDNFGALVNTDLPTVGGFHEKVVIREVDGVAVTADVVRPTGPGPHPVLVYLHGGGWVCGSPATHRKLAYRFAEAGYVVFNVDYRMAPEHPFPAPFDDCVHAIEWVAQEAARFGGDPQHLAVGGDSAGGNLTAAAAAALADKPGAPRIAATLLIYGIFDFAKMGQDLAEHDPLYEIGKSLLEMMVGSYLGPEPRSRELLADPRVSPIRVAAKLPPSYIVVGTLDTLLEQSEDLAKALEKAGIEHEHVAVDAMPHGFAQMEFLPPARPSIARMVAFLDKHLR